MMMDTTQPAYVQGFTSSPKGVMLSKRPVENKYFNFKRPFCARVDPKETLGANPINAIKPLHHKQNINYANANHRHWVKNYSNSIRQRRHEDFQDKAIELYKAKKFKEQSSKMRSWAIQKRGYPTQPTNKSIQLRSILKNAKRGNRQWSRGASLNKQQHREMINFLGHLRGQDYVEDTEIKNIISHMKHRAQALRSSKSSKKNYGAQHLKQNTLHKAQTLNHFFSSGPQQGSQSQRKFRNSSINQRPKNSVRRLPNRSLNNQPRSIRTNKDLASEQDQKLTKKIIKHITQSVIGRNKELSQLSQNKNVREAVDFEVMKILAHSVDQLSKASNKRNKRNKKFIRPPNVIPLALPEDNFSTTYGGKRRYKSKTANLGDSAVQNLPYLYRNPAI